MSKKKGNTMSEEAKSEGPQEPAANQFAPNFIQGVGLVNPAPAPQASELPIEPGEEARQRRAAEAEEAQDEIEEVASDVDAEREAAFVEYVNGDLADEAKVLGYEIKLVKLADPNADFAGATMLYDKDTGEGRVFYSRKDVPAGFITIDQLNALRAEAE